MLPGAGPRRRRWCSDACRKRVERSEKAVVPKHGAVTDAVVSALADIVDPESKVDAARGQVALALARLVDGGSVPAARELRGVLDDLEAVDEDEETTAWIKSLGGSWTEEK